MAAPVSAVAAAKLTELDATNAAITSLVGVQCLTGLQVLYIDHNLVTDLSPLADLPLALLSAGDNQISDVEPLAGIGTLSGLTLLNNDITDASPLGSLTNLQVLILGQNPFSTLNWVAP